MLKVYLAGKISGYSYDEVVNRIKEQKEFLGDKYEVLSPMTGKAYLRNEIEFKTQGYDFAPMSTNHAIFERDKWMVYNADVVFVDLTDINHTSIGCMMELAWASLLGKHTVVIMEENNMHRHAFVMEAADIVFTNTKDALDYLITLADGNE